MTPLDSTIFGPLFTDDEILELFTDEAYIRALVEVEAALARAQAKVGVIPAAAAEQISRVKAADIDITALTEGTIRSGFPIIALVQQIRRQAGAEAGSYVHWGATTQDIMDTAAVLQMRAAIELFKPAILNIIQRLSELAQRHRTTVMAGRTHGQQALPITFGLKVASWIAPMLRHAERLDEILPRLLVIQFGGAAGTLAALGDKGLAVSEALADELKLAVPLMSWHAQRDSLVEFGSWLSLVTGCLGKIAQDVILLAQTEAGEVAESDEEGRGGSSTMPQKSNPITSELMLAAARTNASLLSALHQAQIQEHERATHGWQVEWLTLPQMMILTGGALKHALDLAQNLQVDDAAMRANMARAHDVVLAEAVVFALAKAMPRAVAEELVKNACCIATSEARPLIEVVKETAPVPHGTVDWEALANPANYLGETDKIIDSVLEHANNLFSK
jgi:3-carboxy-cis,cis-muconate cycloisomerase